MRPDRPQHSRRTFLKNVASAGLTAAASRTRILGANDDVRLAVIGLGNKGSAHVRQLGEMAGVRLVAICDVDPTRVEAQKAKRPANSPALACVTEPQRILDMKDVDALVIAAPNHWHALLAVQACQAGKDVYVEKPVSHNIWEGKQIIRAASKYRRIVQSGTQYRSDPGLIEAADYVRKGELGKVLWGHVVWYEQRQSIGRREPYWPEGLDYDLYCGPAPLEPLTRARLHYDWHWIWNTGDGDLANSGIHAFDVCRLLAGIEGLPPRAIGLGGRFAFDDDAGQTPNTQFTVYDYRPAPIVLENRNLPVEKGRNAMDHLRGIREGVILQCEHGYLAGMRGGVNAYDNDKKRLREFAGDGGSQHAANFVSAIRSRNASELKAPIAQGHVSSAACHLGNISYRLGSGMPPASAKSAVGGLTLAQETVDRLEQHLRANGVDLSRTPLQVGRRLHIDGRSDEITAVDGPDAAAALKEARVLARGRYRAKYTLNEVV